MKTTIGTTHPAVAVVVETLRLWDNEHLSHGRSIVNFRAHAIVARLIQDGFLEGIVAGGFAFTKDSIREG